jgi:hypothetical protein
LSAESRRGKVEDEVERSNQLNLGAYSMHYDLDNAVVEAISAAINGIQSGLVL